jgi:lipid II:glycine glycyltransferase (peptidoglycan interpeptide bridge formation enzyme)
LEGSGVKFVVKKSLSDSELNEATDLIEGISARNNFRTRGYGYFKTMQESVPEAIWYLFVDESKGNKIVLANLAVVDISTSTNYDLYVGRAEGYDNLYLSYLLKYFSFKYLKNEGIHYYDHWGVYLDPASPKHKFSVFKLHFGGRVIHYPDIVIVSPLPAFIVKIVAFVLKRFKM